MMFVAANFVSAFATILDMVLQFYMWVIIARAILSWVSPDPYNPIVQFLYKVTEPVLYPIRRRMAGMGMDLSPMIVILLIIFLKTFLVGSLIGLANRLR